MAERAVVPAYSRLPFEWFVAWRYLRTVRQDALVRLLARIAGLGLGIGTAALVLCLAALSGFQDRLLGAVRDNTPALQVEATSTEELAAVRTALSELAGTEAVQEVRVARGWLSVDGRTRSVEFVLHDGPLPSWLGSPVAVARFGLSSEAGGEAGGLSAEVDAARGAWVAADLLRAGTPDQVEVISPRPTLSPAGAVPRTRWLPLEGVLETSDVEEGWAQRVALPLDRRTRALFTAGDLRVDVAPERIADARLSELGGVAGLVAATREAAAALGVPAERVFDWRDRNEALLFVLRLEKSVVFLAVALIVLVASFALLSTLQLLLANKRQEIGVLSSMGASQLSVRRIFFRIGVLLAGLGAVLGALVGSLGAWCFDRFQLLRIPGDLLIVDYVPFSVRPIDVLGVVSCALLTTTAVSVLGARRASRLRVKPTVRV